MEYQLGIVFTGGEGPHPQTIRRIVDRVYAAGTSVLLVAADSGLMLAEAAGLKPDWIIGDMDSMDNEGRLCSYQAENVIRHPIDKDYTDTELALSLLWEKGCPDAWITGGGGGRIDHLFGIRDLFEREHPPARWLTAAEDIYCIDGNSAGNAAQGLTVTFNQDSPLTANSVVSVFPLGSGPWQAESTGLKWPLKGVCWERGLYGLSNVAVMPKIEINALRGRFMGIIQKEREEYYDSSTYRREGYCAEAPRES